MTATSFITTGKRDRKLDPAGRRFDWGQPFVYLIALVVAALAIGPVLYVIIGGFRTTADLNANPGGFPNPWVFENYAQVLSTPRFWGGNVLASIILATATTLGVVILGIMAAYPIARYSFKGREGLYTMFTAGLMFPLTVAALPPSHCSCAPSASTARTSV